MTANHWVTDRDPAMKKRPVNLTINAETRARMEVLAEEYGGSLSSVVTVAVNQMYDRHIRRMEIEDEELRKEILGR